MCLDIYRGVINTENVANEINAIFDILQGLDIKGTPNNVRILDATYNSLRNIYKELGGKENAGESRTEVDSCGRNAD